MEKDGQNMMVSTWRVAVAACLAAWGAGAADMSFSLTVAKDAGQPRQTVVAAEMKSFSEEADRLVWRGHPLLGDAFTVTATRKAVAAGTEWEFAYEGNGTDWFVEEVAFPEWTVPRTARTRVVGLPTPIRSRGRSSGQARVTSPRVSNMVSWSSPTE